MPRKTVWTDGQDAQIRRLRTEGASWDIVALALGLGSEPNYFLAPTRAGRIQAPWLIGADQWPTNSG